MREHGWSLLLFLIVPASASGAAPPEFEKDVLPILTQHCVTCHGGLRQRSDLDLRTVATLQQGGKSGPAALPNQAGDSLLLRKIGNDEMPKALTKLNADEKKVIRDWITGGMRRTTALAEAALANSDLPRPPTVAAAEIDRAIEKRLAQAGLQPAALSSDAEFLRRVYLDVIGQLPPPERVAAFAASQEPDKRAMLLDELLKDRGYGMHWGRTWHHRLMPLVDGKREYNQPLIDWLAASLNENRKWNAIVTDLITAVGDGATQPQVAFLAAHTEMDKAAVKAGELFLGIALECAECHDHPSAKWKQKEDYWGLAAFFVNVKPVKKGEIVSLIEAPINAKGAKPGAFTGPMVKIPTGTLTGANAVVKAGFPGAPPLSSVEAPYRAALAAWMTSPDHPTFAAATANRWWAHFFARGLVEPLNDIHDGSIASHPEVLAILVGELRASKWDLRHLIRCICLTRAYQRSSRTTAANDELEKAYGRMPLRLLTPDVLYSALMQTLKVKDLNLSSMGVDTKKKAIIPARRNFVNLLEHRTDTEAGAYDHGVLQILEFMNFRDFNTGGGIAQELAAVNREPAEAVDELYLRALSRKPSASEREKLVQFVMRQADRKEAYASVLWLLVNASEFVFNH